VLFINKLEKILYETRSKMAIFCTRHVGSLVDTRGPIVMSSTKKTLILQLVAYTIIKFAIEKCAGKEF
jgi:hypothetical protein